VCGSATSYACCVHALFSQGCGFPTNDVKVLESDWRVAGILLALHFLEPFRVSTKLLLEHDVVTYRKVGGEHLLSGDRRCGPCNVVILASVAAYQVWSKQAGWQIPHWDRVSSQGQEAKETF
jgi:hypothetical protein